MEISNIPVENNEIFDSRKPLKLLIHGWTADRNHVSLKPLKNAYLSRGDVNLLIVDWPNVSKLPYEKSRILVKNVGARIGQLLNELMTKAQIDPKNIHLIGHSLGAHIAGNIGRYLNEKLGRITGLDPAGPLFPKEAQDALSQSDADMVDVIHSDDILGSLIPRGKADFYPNKGTHGQPGCQKILDAFQRGSTNYFSSCSFIKNLFIFIAGCNHFRAVQFFAESILNPRAFPAFQCRLDEFLNGANGKMCIKSSNGITLMGDSLGSNANGTFYLETYDEAPFGKGSASLQKT